MPDEQTDVDIVAKLHALIVDGSITCSIRTSMCIRQIFERREVIYDKDDAEFEVAMLREPNIGKKSMAEIHELIRLSGLTSFTSKPVIILKKITIEDFLFNSSLAESADLHILFHSYPRDMSVYELIKLQLVKSEHLSRLNSCRLMIILDLIGFEEALLKKPLSELRFDNFDNALFQSELLEENINKSIELMKKSIGEALVTYKTAQAIRSIYSADFSFLSNLDLNSSETMKRMHLLISGLTDRELVVVIRRMLAPAPSSLSDLYEIYGLSRDRVRQIESKAIRKLRHPARQPNSVPLLLSLYILSAAKVLEKDLCLNSGVIPVEDFDKLLKGHPLWVAGAAKAFGVNVKIFKEYKGFYYSEDFFDKEFLDLAIHTETWFEQIQHALFLNNCDSADLLEIAPFLTNHAIKFFLSYRSQLSKKLTIEDVCERIINQNKKPMTKIEIFEKYNFLIDKLTTERSIQGALVSSSKVFSLGKGLYCTSSTMPIKYEKVENIKKLSTQVLSSLCDDNYLTADNLMKYLRPSTDITGLTSNLLYSILKNDKRFYCCRDGKRVKLSN